MKLSLNNYIIWLLVLIFVFINSETQAFPFSRRREPEPPEITKADLVIAQARLKSAALSMSRGEYQDAILAYQDFLQDFPNEISVKVNLADAYCRLDRWEDSLNQVLPVLKLEGLSAEASGASSNSEYLNNFNRAGRIAVESFIKSNQISAGISFFLAEIQQLTDYRFKSRLLKSLSTLYSKNSEYEKALFSLNSALELGLVSPEVYSELLNLYLTTDQISAGIELMQAAPPEARDGYNLLKLVQLYERNGQKNSGLAILTRLLADNTQPPIVHERAVELTQRLSGGKALPPPEEEYPSKTGEVLIIRKIEENEEVEKIKNTDTSALFQSFKVIDPLEQLKKISELDYSLQPGNSGMYQKKYSDEIYKQNLTVSFSVFDQPAIGSLAEYAEGFKKQQKQASSSYSVKSVEIKVPWAGNHIYWEYSAVLNNIDYQGFCLGFERHNKFYNFWLNATPGTFVQASEEILNFFNIGHPGHNN